MKASVVVEIARVMAEDMSRFLCARNRVGYKAGRMPAAPLKRRSSPVADTLLVVVSLLVCAFVAELVVRGLNGQPLLAFPLPDPVGSASVKPGQLERIKLADGVDRAWFE